MTDDLIAAMGRPQLPNLRRPAPPKPAPAPAPAPEPVVAEAPAPPAPKPSRPRAAAKKPPGRPGTGRSPKGIGLPAPLVEPMNTAAAEAGLSRGDWFMAALNDVWDELPKVYPPLPTVRPELPPPRRPPRQHVAGGRVAVNFRFTAEQAAAIDARKDALQVESRSEFVTAVVNLKLQPESAPPRRGR